MAPRMSSWPGAVMNPFRSEKNTNWEGAFLVSVDKAAQQVLSRGPSMRAGGNRARRHSARRWHSTEEHSR
jgi:hypothetical protein